MHIEKKGIGINPSSLTHYIDHLAVICIIMDIPLLFIDEEDFILAKKYYPELKAEWAAYEELTPEYLIARYDVLYMSDLWDRHTFHEKYAPLEKQYKKQLRHVHCPHGFSDKAFYLRKCANEDITLIYGQNMCDMLKKEGVFEQLNQYVITGNYRYTYFKKHRSFFDKIVKDEILSKFEKQQPLILYAPTWLDLEESTTFFDAASFLLDNLPDHYNMLVKLHPRLELDDVALYYQILGKYELKKNILFLKDFPLVFPILAYTDIYIGDTSSVGYDFLAFNKPMFFLNKQPQNPTLFQCGTVITPADYHNLYKIIASQLPQNQLSPIRSQLYEYTFGPEIPFEQIKQNIIQACT
ncbi:MAG: CDP-glycerol glycerophosphotransferase family protein [Parachlamydiaceae bacterium]|nr:CDP-glycerol glycerophosphotransferase family protein [Parachlamydiaceae bacterium]